MAWQRGIRLSKLIYRATRVWPPEERYGLTSQIRRAAISVVANIAEGSAKRGSREFRRYLDISLGSLEEVACLLIVARELEMLNQSGWETLEAEREQLGRALWGLYRSLSETKSG